MEPFTEQGLGRAFKTNVGEPRGDLQGTAITELPKVRG